MRLKNIFNLILYLSFAKYLPASDNKYYKFIRIVRRMICKPLFLYAGKNINIEQKANFGIGNDIKIGDNSGLGVNCHIRGPLTIGNDVMMGPNVRIITHSHNFERTDIPMREQKGTITPVHIGDDVWIGANVIILPGVSIGKGVVIGAGSVVTKNFPDYVVIGGVPAKILKFRKS